MPNFCFPPTGGNIGLFNGFSLMVFIELFQLLVYLAVPKLVFTPRQDKPTFLLQYFDSATLHALTYIANSRPAAARALWCLAAFSALISCSILLSLTVHEFGQNKLLRFLDHEGANISSVPYPTITICPVQFNDR